MKINADFTKPAVVTPETTSWRGSPEPGVERLMLDRIGDEVARATSLVRYAPHSRFASHVHDLGEEFLVLDGVFSDDTGNFGPGTYVRNPPGSAHAPWSEPGATIFVKLRQFDLHDASRVVIDSTTAPWQDGHEDRVRTLALHTCGAEVASLLRLDAGARLRDQYYAGGAEILVLDGSLETECARLGIWGWLRLPAGAIQTLASPTGCTAYVKTGHLRA